MADLLNRWAKAMVTGGNPLLFPSTASFPAVSLADSKHSIVCLSNQIRVYFLQTRQCIRTLDMDLSGVLAVFLDPEHSNQIILFTATEIVHVNWMDKVETPELARQTISPAVPGLQGVCHVSEKQYLAVSMVDDVLAVSTINRETAASKEVFLVHKASRWSVSSNGHQLAVLLLSNAVVLHSLTAAIEGVKGPRGAIQASREKHQYSHKQVTCMAVSNGGVVALGTESGAINLVYGGVRTGKPQRTLRWHIDPVGALAFSEDEVYLVSGGNEKVLVFWHLDTDRTQFLPRLAGPIERIHVDSNRPDHYAVALRVMDSPRAHELLIILSVDLVSRLSVSAVKPAFHPAGSGKSKPVHLLAKMLVHPLSKHVYFARDALIQAFDVARGEQAFLQHVAPQILTGRVRSEHSLADPSVTAVAFTKDGLWMATFDAMPALDFDNLMSRNDVSYALKFWKWSDSAWLLSLKIVDPHGPGLEIGAVVSKGHAFFTVDTKGGIRTWRPKSIGPKSPTAWSLRKALVSAATEAPVAACFSGDGSIFVVSHGTTARIHDPELLQPVEFPLPATELPIEALHIIDSYLVIVSAMKMILFDLIAAFETPLVTQISTPGSGTLVAVDSARKIIALATNEARLSGMDSKVLLFSPDSVVPLSTIRHHNAIASMVSTPSGFLFLDTYCQLGMISPEIKTPGATEDLAAEMKKLLVNAQAAANVLFTRAAQENTQAGLEDPSKSANQKLLDVALLQPLFSNVEGASLESLFERVVRAVQ